MKLCPKCKVMKPRRAFQKNRVAKDGLQFHCRACRSAIDSRPAKRKADRERYHANTDAYRDRQYKRLYGITLVDYNKMLRRQHGACAVCREAPTSKRLAVDHDHATGKVRALLCTRCNPLIGYARDNPATLRKIAAYLERHA